MMVRRIHLILLGLVASLAVVAAGCGGTSMAVPELTSFDTVAAKSSSADAARFAMEMKVTMPGTSKALAFSADGAFDTSAQRSEMTVDMAAFADLFKMLGSSLGGTVTGDMGSADDWKLHVIQDGKTAYIQFPLLTKQLPAGKTWVMGDAKDLSQADAGGIGQFGSLAGTDPKDVFGILKAVSGSIEAVGTEEIRGVETSHYRATLDPVKIQKLMPSGSSLDGLGASAGTVDEVPLDIWIDADQRVRKLSVEAEQKQPGTDKTAKASLVLEVYDYGTSVDIQLPPADQVADASTLKTS
jgi:hypothetical protein